MRQSKILSFLSLLLVAAVGLAAPARALLMPRSVPPASFLNYHVDTASQLTYEVTYDRVVQARLAHHFHLSGPAMCAYVRDNLVLKRLPAPFRTRVYCLSPRGREYFVIMTLKRGSLVFALRRTGQPILRLVCGNPLVAALPPTPAKKAAAARPPVSHVKPSLLERAAAPPAHAILAAPSVPSAATLPTVSVISGTPSGVIFTATGSVASAGPPVWLVWLPVAGGLVAVLPHGGGSDSPSGPVPGLPTLPETHPTSGTPPLIIPPPGGPVPGGPPPPAVPEPNPACVFAIGALALGALRLARRA